MADLKLVEGADSSWDLSFDGNDLELTDDLETAVLISLMTVARAKKSDALPDGSDRLRGWWGDAHQEISGDKTGSRLWILSREKLTDAALPRLRQILQEALAWLTVDGVASAVVVECAIYSLEVVAVRITIEKPRGVSSQFEYFLNWEAQAIARPIQPVEVV